MLLSCGDALIDFVPIKALDGRDAFMPVVGGSCLNVAVAMARLDAPAGLAGGISTDLFGTMIAEHALRSNVDLRYVIRSSDETTLAFVRLLAGEPHYVFYDEATAARRWTYRARSIPFAVVDAIHVGSTTLISHAVSTETLAMLAEARGSATISFDPNCRPTLVHDKPDYIRRMEDFLARADIIRMSDADFEFLFRSTEYGAKAATLLESGATLVIVTRGERGVLAWHRHAGYIEVTAPQVDVVDTIGPARRAARDAGNRDPGPRRLGYHQLAQSAHLRGDLRRGDLQPRRCRSAPPLGLAAPESLSTIAALCRGRWLGAALVTRRAA
jgi:fructokinase